jgi:hypothetical protein
MYSITTRGQQVFGVLGYNAVKKYEDPDKQILDRKY